MRWTLPLSEHLLQGPDIGWQEGPLLETVDDIRQKESVLFQKASSVARRTPLVVR